MTFLYNQPFLVTTGRITRNIESAKVLIAGDWCSEIAEKLSKNNTTEMIDYPISSLDAAQIKKEIGVVFDALLSKVAAAYNEVFGLNKNEKYYKIVLGRWIYHFLHNLYEKRAILNRAITKHHDVWMESCGKTYSLSFDSDGYNQMSYSSHDFNYQMYSGVAEFCGIKKKYINIDSIATPRTTPNITKKESLRSSLQHFICVLNRFFRNRMTLVVSPYYQKNSLYNALWFFIKSHGEIVHHTFSPLLPSNKELDISLRMELSRKICGNNNQNQLLNIASELFFYFIPQSFVEYLNTYRKNAVDWIKEYPHMNRMFTANAIHTNEAFKYLVAEAQPRELCISQHGAGYGFSEVQSSEDYENELANYYFTWGWGDHVLPHPKLLSDRAIRYKSNKDIVFTFPTVTEYAGLLESFFIASTYQHTINLTDQLFEKITPQILAKIVLRQRQKKGLRMYNPKIDMRKDCIPLFQESLKRARIHLSNHIGTPVLESLSMNLPTIIVYDPAAHKLRSSAIHFFEELKNAQILFEDSLKAAHHLNSIYTNIDEWWMSNTTQAAIRSFCFQFARSDRNWKSAWLNALKFDT